MHQESCRTSPQEVWRNLWDPKLWNSPSSTRVVSPFFIRKNGIPLRDAPEILSDSGTKSLAKFSETLEPPEFHERFYRLFARKNEMPLGDASELLCRKSDEISGTRNFGSSGVPRTFFLFFSQEKTRCRLGMHQKSYRIPLQKVSEFDQSFFSFFHKKKRDTALRFIRNPVGLPHKKPGEISGTRSFKTLRVRPEFFLLFS